MLPGGGAPVARLVLMMRNAPPSQAADLLVAMPPERFGAVLGEMRPADLARIVAAVKPGKLPAILAAVPPDRILDALRTMQIERAAEFLGTLPERYRSPILDGLSAEELPPLLEAMNPTQRAALLGTLDLDLPEQAPRPETAVPAGSAARAVPSPAVEPTDAAASQALAYQRSVEQAVGRTAATVTSLAAGQHGALIVEMFGRVFVVAPRYHERGQLTVDEVSTVEEAAAQLLAQGLLVVTNRPTPRDVAAYRAFAHDRGRLIDVVTWVDARHDGLLQRALVSLVR